jgi:hypothetical protein
MKAQSSMIAIVISVLMLVFLFIFLLSAPTVSQVSQSLNTEYRNLFAHNALLSILAMDTECGVFSDVLKGAYFGGGKCDSEAFVNSRLPSSMDGILNATGHTDYAWLLEATPDNFDGVVLSLGDPSVKGSRESWDARTFVSWEGYRLEVLLYFKTI